jgi:hypothetical protein
VKSFKIGGVSTGDSNIIDRIKKAHRQKHNETSTSGLGIEKYNSVNEARSNQQSTIKILTRENIIGSITAA